MSSPAAPFDAAKVAAMVGGEVVGDPGTPLLDLAPLDSAGPKDLSFLANIKYRDAFLASKAGAVLVAEVVPEAKTTQIRCDNPYFAMAQVAVAMHPGPKPVSGIHPQAFVDPEASVHGSASVGPGAMVAAGASVGADAVVSALAYVGEEAVIHAGAFLHAGAKVLHRCHLGARSILHAGAVIGSDGFGYAPDAEGKRHKIPQVGVVVVEEDVEIGANTTVDRATFGVTRIGKGTKIDNLVQIAHNVQLGEHCVIVSQTGIAGSTHLGDQVIVGAQVGIAGHLKIAAKTMFGARAGVASSIETPGVYSGVPAMPHKQWLRSALSTKNLPELRRELSRLRKDVQRLLGQTGA